MWLIIATIIIGTLLIVWSLCKIAAPATALERYLSDEEQIKFINEWVKRRSDSTRPH